MSWASSKPHSHFLVRIGYGFLGVLENFVTGDHDGRRQFDFDQKKPAGEKGDALVAARSDAEDLLAEGGVDLAVRLRRAGLSQQNLASHLGVSAAFLSAVLSGKKPWPPGMRERAEAFVAGGVEELVAEAAGEVE
jgi:hypothetical protein